jgi:hypothetical protein
MNQNRQSFTNFEIIPNAIDLGQLSEILKTTAEIVYDNYPEFWKELRINETIDLEIYERFQKWMYTISDCEQVLITLTISDSDQGAFIHIHGAPLANNGAVYCNEEICKKELEQFFGLYLT